MKLAYLVSKGFENHPLSTRNVWSERILFCGSEKLEEASKTVADVFILNPDHGDMNGKVTLDHDMHLSSILHVLLHNFTGKTIHLHACMLGLNIEEALASVKLSLDKPRMWKITSFVQDITWARFVKHGKVTHMMTSFDKWVANGLKLDKARKNLPGVVKLTTVKWNGSQLSFKSTTLGKICYRTKLRSQY